MKVNDITITSLETITSFDYATGNYQFTIDELQDFKIDQTEDQKEVLGRNGRKLNTLKRNKAVKISGTNGLVSSGLMELQTGSKFETKATEVMWTDYLTVGASNKVNTTYKAVGTTGAEITDLFIRNDDGTLGQRLTQDSTAGEGTFKYTPGTKELQFHTNVEVGTEIVVYYNRKISADVLSNNSDTFAQKSALYVDCLGEDNHCNIYKVQFYIPRADFSGEFSMEIGDNQTVHAFSAEALAGNCGIGNQFYTYTVFGADAADAE